MEAFLAFHRGKKTLIPVTLLSRSPWCCLSLLSLSALKKFLLYDLAIPANNPPVDSCTQKGPLTSVTSTGAQRQIMAGWRKHPHPAVPETPLFTDTPQLYPKPEGDEVQVPAPFFIIINPRCLWRETLRTRPGPCSALESPSLVGAPVDECPVGLGETSLFCSTSSN